MIITMNDKKYDISLRLAAEIEEFGSRVAELESLKSEKKKNYKLEIWDLDWGTDLIEQNLELTHTQALKLSEAISTLVEYGTEELEEENPKAVYFPDTLAKAAQAFRKSYQGGQNE